ncbi:MAG: type VI secretion system ATPase TssH, partial [Actinobacteria bacterium]|nr:type VI secretion system ATPase TssH [Actinomycetota bacterium]
MATPFDPNRWTIKTQEAFQGAVAAARGANHPEVVPEHLLSALLGQQEGVVLAILERLGVAPLALRNQLAEALSRLPKVYGGAEPQLSRALREAMEAAEEARVDFGDDYLSTEHLLLAMADGVGVGREQLLGALAEVRGSHRVTSANPEESY